MKLLVTGTGRCGTSWIAKCLSEAGVPTSHEVAFNNVRHGEGKWTSECSWKAAPFTPVKNCYTVHLVRDPIKTIQSRLALGRDLWGREYCPEIETWNSELFKTAQHWVSWNLLIKADERIRVEDVKVEDVLRWARKLNRRAKLEKLPDPYSKFPGRGRRPEVTWEDLGRVPGLVKLARDYGYSPGSWVVQNGVALGR